MSGRLCLACLLSTSLRRCMHVRLYHSGSRPIQLLQYHQSSSTRSNHPHAWELTIGTSNSAFDLSVFLLEFFTMLPLAHTAHFSLERHSMCFRYINRQGRDNHSTYNVFVAVFNHNFSSFLASGSTIARWVTDGGEVYWRQTTLHHILRSSPFGARPGSSQSTTTALVSLASNWAFGKRRSILLLSLPRKQALHERRVKITPSARAISFCQQPTMAFLEVICIACTV